MRHNKTVNHLGRQASHRKAMMANMACSLLMHKRINTTLAKAKALQGYVEPLITKGKTDTTHSRRIVFSYLKQKEAVAELFGPIAAKVGDRPGGYTRILKTGFRKGDAAETCFIELVDFNEIYTTDKKAAKAGAKRTRRAGGAVKTEKTPVAAKAEKIVETVPVAEVVEATAPAVEETTTAE